VAGKADPSPITRLYHHPDSPFTANQLAAGAVVSFEKLKLTNNQAADKPTAGHVSITVRCRRGRMHTRDAFGSQAQKVHETTTFLLVTLPNIHRFANLYSPDQEEPVAMKTNKS